MALQKTITLPNGAQGNYVRIEQLEQQYAGKSVSCHLMLYASKVLADAGAPPLARIGKIRLNGAGYDRFLSRASLQALQTRGPDPVRDQLYAAAKLAIKASKEGEDREPGVEFVACGGYPLAHPSVAGPVLDLSDAQDV
jgi:hypothetical protein